MAAAAASQRAAELAAWVTRTKSGYAPQVDEPDRGIGAPSNPADSGSGAEVPPAQASADAPPPGVSPPAVPRPRILRRSLLWTALILALIGCVLSLVWLIGNFDFGHVDCEWDEVLELQPGRRAVGELPKAKVEHISVVAAYGTPPLRRDGLHDRRCDAPVVWAERGGSAQPPVRHVAVTARDRIRHGVSLLLGRVALAPHHARVAHICDTAGGHVLHLRLLGLVRLPLACLSLLEHERGWPLLPAAIHPLLLRRGVRHCRQRRPPLRFGGSHATAHSNRGASSCVKTSLLGAVCA